jgi:hypothetical protein
MALKLRLAGAADKIKSLHWAFRPRRRPQADSFKRRLGSGMLITRKAWEASQVPEVQGLAPAPMVLVVLAWAAWETWVDAASV